MKLPAYPIATIDPHFSIWSRCDSLTDDDTYLWCGIRMKIDGILSVDGESFRFLGKGDEPAIEQKEAKITPYISDYIFENEKVRLSFKTWSPFLFDDFHLLSTPVAFFDTTVTSLDGEKHQLSVSFTATNELCGSKNNSEITKYTDTCDGTKFAIMGLTEQEPLHTSGDTFKADWGYVCLMGGEVALEKKGIRIKSETKNVKKAAFTCVISYDDVYSINYFGEKLKGLWTEKFPSIGKAMKYCLDNKDSLLTRIKAQEKMILEDSKEFGKDYQSILSAAARQVLAAHKLVRNSKGQLLYMSKECHSNGCINTVDVSYPAAPMYLLYTPKLIKAMLVGIFEFAKMPLWKEDFAPHDIGRYPLACGQVYALKPHRHIVPHSYSYKRIYKAKGTNIYMPEFQMPVEECGNMLILTYAYYRMTGDKSFLTENYYTLSTWAKYLRSKGVILDNQLCTDDFAGHSKKNVNLAIKAIMGLAVFGKITEELGLSGDWEQTARAFADELVSACGTEKGHLPFSVDKKDSWSLKYNLVWDILFDFKLFDKEIYKAETDKYREQLNAYGVPLDYRRDFTKTDWELWAACLDETKENVALFSECICRYLADTKDRNCFTDWPDTKQAKQCGFDHRTVQAGLWMPVLFRKFGK
ncbi:MAG: DUF4965 domain-containing protein [Clostridia bacterium]|nr:DUF4965 domain-containing protein [Clostridia bacterium]